MIDIQIPESKDHHASIGIVLTSKAKWTKGFLSSPRFLADMAEFSFLLRVVSRRHSQQVVGMCYEARNMFMCLPLTREVVNLLYGITENHCT